jgi:hypothetical protein
MFFAIDANGWTQGMDTQSSPTFPNADHVMTRHGVVSLKFLNSECIIASSRENEGYLTLLGAQHLVTAHYVLEDGQWIAKVNQHNCAWQLEGKPSPAPVQSEMWALLDDLVPDWVETRPDIIAQVRLFEADQAVARALSEISRLEEALRTLKGDLPHLCDERVFAALDLEKASGAKGGRAPLDKVAGDTDLSYGDALSAFRQRAGINRAGQVTPQP